MRVKIYSDEHNAWWKDNYFGYTNNESEAGIFEIEEINKKYPYIDFDTTKEDYLVKFECLEYEELEKENTKLKEVIKFLGEQLDLDVDLENHNLITEEGTIGFLNIDEETMSILELLKEVLEE